MASGAGILAVSLGEFQALGDCLAAQALPMWVYCYAKVSILETFSLFWRLL